MMWILNIIHKIKLILGISSSSSEKLKGYYDIETNYH